MLPGKGNLYISFYLLQNLRHFLPDSKQPLAQISWVNQIG